MTEVDSFSHDKPGKEIAEMTGDKWAHLKKYGYAPGGYMLKCHSCFQTSNADKRATLCLECAQNRYSGELELTGKRTTEPKP